MSRAAVVGAAGFIGSHLCTHLAERGTAVLGIDRHEIAAGVPVHRRLQADFPRTEVCDAIKSHRADHVYLLAGTSSVRDSLADPLADLSGNIRDTVAFLEWIRQEGYEATVVFASSAAVYGEPVNLPITIATAPQPVSPYGISKLAGELYVRMYARMHGLDGRVVRPFSVYGPGLQKQVVWDILRKLDGTGPQTLAGTGTETRDFVYVEDVCSAFLAVADKGTPGGIYNVCSGAETTIARLASILSTMTDRPALDFSGDVRLGDPRHWRGACTELEELGWQPKVSLDEGLARTVQWFRQHTSYARAQNAGAVLD